ncbi:hypothetical protein PQX77_001366 [Marasmius sp. AFHP31]|nr:hypothetical protein PQX77_001366 [Marasmius sp. AFHP31]
MDLIFSQDDPTNATLSLPTGQQIYELYTKARLLHSDSTIIRKFDSGHYAGSPPRDIGQVKLRSFGDDVCELLGRDIRPRSEDLFSGKRHFTSLITGQKYSWKRKTSKVLLIDKFQNTIAVYEYSHSGIFHAKAPAMLSITPNGLPFLDEIVVTFVYAEQRFRKEIEAAGEAAGDAASSAA